MLWTFEMASAGSVNVVDSATGATLMRVYDLHSIAKPVRILVSGRRWLQDTSKRKLAEFFIFFAPPPPPFLFTRVPPSLTR